jgi:hypothetical protein
MATNRKRIPRNRKETDLTAGQLAWLNSEPYDDNAKGFSFFCAYENAGQPQFRTSKELWDNYKADILEKWIADHPCTRPERWWEFDTTEVRLRLGGIGKQNEFEPCFKNGVPSSWYPVKDNNPPWSKSSIPDRPCFESQAAYLQRHNLLTTAEKKFLKNHPELLEPEKV